MCIYIYIHMYIYMYVCKNRGKFSRPCSGGAHIAPDHMSGGHTVPLQP